jgi:hypothetical protein
MWGLGLFGTGLLVPELRLPLALVALLWGIYVWKRADKLTRTVAVLTGVLALYGLVSVMSWFLQKQDPKRFNQPQAQTPTSSSRTHIAKQANYPPRKHQASLQNHGSLGNARPPKPTSHVRARYRHGEPPVASSEHHTYSHASHVTANRRQIPQEAFDTSSLRKNSSLGRNNAPDNEGESASSTASGSDTGLRHNSSLGKDGE